MHRQITNDQSAVRFCATISRLNENLSDTNRLLHTLNSRSLSLCTRISWNNSFVFANVKIENKRPLDKERRMTIKSSCRKSRFSICTHIVYHISHMAQPNMTTNIESLWIRMKTQIVALSLRSKNYKQHFLKQNCSNTRLLFVYLILKGHDTTSPSTRLLFMLQFVQAFNSFYLVRIVFWSKWISLEIDFCWPLESTMSY